MDTLVLNADGQPLTIIPISTYTWEEAIKQVFLDRVDVVAQYPDWEVHSPSMTIPVPSVVMLREYTKTSKMVAFSREAVMLRDNWHCQYCGGDFYHNKRFLTFDHVIPKVRGGKTRWNNIVTACQNCNSEKGHGDHMKPLTPAKAPSYYALVDIAKQRPITMADMSWNSFLQWDEGLITIKKNFDTGR